MLWLHTGSLQEKNNAFSCPTAGDDNIWKLTVLVVLTFTGIAVHSLSSCVIVLWILLAVDLSIIYSEGFLWLNPALYNISQRAIQVQEMWYNLLILKRTLSLFCLTLLVSFYPRLSFLNSLWTPRDSGHISYVLSRTTFGSKLWDLHTLEHMNIKIQHSS